MIRIAEVQEFCETGTGGTPSRGKITLYYGGNIPWVKSGELHQAVILDTREKITEIAIQEARLKIVTKNAILIAMYGATVGQVSRLGIDATTNQAVCHLLPDVEVCFPSYLYYCLLSKRREFLFRRVGGGQSNISQGIIRTTKIPLPPLPEQKRIAAILEKADGVRKKSIDQVEPFGDLTQAIFQSMFGNLLYLPQNRLDGVSEIKSGIAKGKKYGDTQLVEVPYIRVANVQAGYLKLGKIKTLLVRAEEIERYSLNSDDILMTEGGDIDKLARGAIWPGEISPCIHQNHVFRVRVDRKKMLPEYFAALLKTDFARKYFLRAAKKTSNLASINKTQLSAFLVPTPEVELQKEFANRIKAVRALETKQKQAAQDAEDLFQSLLQRAFKGEL